MRIVCDTNVLVSAILYGGRPREVLETLITGRAQGFISPALEKELRGVLSRPKFGLTPGQTDLVGRTLRDLVVLVHPRHEVLVIKDDPDDNAVLACAVEAAADCIVTGDEHLLALKHYQGIDIQSPAAFLDRLGEAAR